MSKKIIIGMVVAMVMALTPLFVFAEGEVRLNAEELKAELARENVRISMQEAINTAEFNLQGKAVSCAFRRLLNNQLCYSILVLLNKTPADLKLVLVHATTGKIVLSQSYDSFLIVPPKTYWPEWKEDTEE
ncbi:MAG: hypothetical protein WC321_06020 [Candidatus Omnitrophota bacterium]|jgi:hypothetical protein